MDSNSESSENENTFKQKIVISNIVPPLLPDPVIIKNSKLDDNIELASSPGSPIVRTMTEEEVKQLSLKMLSYIETRTSMHADAANSFAKKQCFLFIPSIILSTTCTILSFLLSSVAENNTYAYLEIALGVCNIVTCGLVTLSNALGFQKSESQHRTTAELYDTILTRLNLKCMEYNPSFNYDRFFDDIQNQIEENKARCKVMIPSTFDDDCDQKTLNTFRQKLQDVYEQRLANEQHRTQLREITVKSLQEERVRIMEDSKNLKQMEKELHME